MKKSFEYFSLFHNKDRLYSIAINQKMLVSYILIFLLFGCSSIEYNIKSSEELSGKKLLTGRFVFFNNDLPFENSERFKIFFKNKLDNKLRVFKHDDTGYVYIPVDEGQYYINIIEYRDFQGQLRFPVHQIYGINIDTTDKVVNFGTIKVSLQQNESSRIAYLSKYAYPYAGKFIPSSQKPELKMTQLSQWNVVNNYISSKLEISPELFRDEVIEFTEEKRAPFE